MAPAREQPLPAERRRHGAPRTVGRGAVQPGGAAFFEQLQIHRARDEPEVRERLRKVSEKRAGRSVQLLGKKTDVVRVFAQALEEAARVAAAAFGEQRIDEPEAADEKRAFR